ncbi:hypothetical protein FEM48_Zijuj11G0120500 [Ziziphus jujuba var. spinosa]|uniref:Fe2OG dioxygenase domain-containing protein n=1 Tax=Ziziphus jujuba var. spinosa TaxID=714518 RepID=A0A978UIT9_ZIZJJ|nr:hypothetical protein FEM48_Zijuj11G0120500 [Ziziphus jujuba var. spinosa]
MVLVRKKELNMEDIMHLQQALNQEMSIVSISAFLKAKVKIVRTIQKLGLGGGGFYKTGPRRALMGLGLTWEPIKYKYEFQRSVDGSETQPIPLYLSFLVKRSLQDAYSHIEKVTNLTSVESILLSMSPNTAIINFYPTGGGLNLHQDRNESKESLRKGLPVVSFSNGDSGEVLYGDDRDEYAAENIILESGDLLIFGGKSRHIFHGVRPVIPNSAPKELLEEIGLRPGRLNLTFRKY